MKEHKSDILDEFFRVDSKVDYQKTLAKMTIAKKISEGMAKNKIGKKEMATILKQQPSVITKWLSGTHNFTIETLVELQCLLRVKLIF